MTQLKESGARHAVYYLAYVISQRNEDTTNPHKFRARIKEESTGWNILDDFRDYILFRAADLFPESPRALGAVFRIEAVSPIVDQYETFIRLAAHEVAANSRFSPAFATALTTLDSIRFDGRLRKFLFLTAPERYPIDDALLADPAVSNSIMVGDYEKAAAHPFLQSSMDRSLMLSAVARAELKHPIQPGSGLSGKIGACIERLVAKHDEEDAVIEADRISLNFRFCSFAAPFVEFVWDLATDVTVAPAPVTRTAFIYSRHLDSHTLYALDEPGKHALARRFSFSQNVADKAELFRSNVEHALPDGLSGEMNAMMRGDRAWLLRDLKQAVGVSEALCHSSTSYVARYSLRLRSNAWLQLGDIRNALEAVVNGYLSDAKVARMLPITSCVEALDRPLLRALAATLSTPIILDLFTRLVNDSRISQRRYAYDDFLIAAQAKTAFRAADTGVTVRIAAVSLLPTLHLRTGSDGGVNFIQQFSGSRKRTTDGLSIAN